MPPSALIIFLIALAFNIAAKIVLRYAGRLRTGIDALLFCSVLSGYFYGVKSGMLYGALIAAAFYVINIRWAAHAPYVMPLNAAAGAVSAMLSGLPLVTAAVFAMIFYHLISFSIALLAYRSIGPGYILFVALNFVTTYMLMGFVVGFA
ncbi:MAG: hypothetical protein HYW26_04185 [Candidatus Aenigmarchaeota archaeon]|nr:hypothetical protein [Candidatus Aenigmarchaeota archaeon]